MTQPYNRFARHYHEGDYTQFTRWICSTVFPHFQQALEFQPGSLLDLACGTGIFASHMAAKGLRVTGLDISPHMLEIARKIAREQGTQVSWVQADMCRFNLGERFDCVTCFFDSLNYLLKAEELARAFQAVSAHLNPGGRFIFDMNTIYGLAVSWQRFPYNLTQDQPDYLELMGTSYDYELNIADVRFIMFEREGERWSRFEEVHRERGYHLDDILLMLEQAGLQTGYILGEPLTLRPLAESDGRVWITAQKVG